MGSTYYDWSPLFDAVNQNVNRYSEQNRYNQMLQQLIGKPVMTPGTLGAPPLAAIPTQINATPPQLPGGPAPRPMTANLSVGGAPGTVGTPGGMSFDGPAGQALGSSANTLLPLLRNAPPSMGFPLLLQSVMKNADRQQQIQDSRVTPLSDEEAQARGLRKGGKYGLDLAGNIVTIQASDMKSEGAMGQQLAQHQAEQLLTPEALAQKKELERLSQAPQWAALKEKQDEFKASNPMLAAGGSAGPAPLSSYPQATQAMVRAMIEGRQAPPTSFALSKPYWQNMIALANSVDPGFDQTQWTSRVAARKDMLGGGKSYQTLNAGNTAIQHLGHLNDQISSVSGVPIPVVGGLVNSALNHVEQPYTGGLNTYNDTLGHLAEETTKFYRGTGGSEADIERNMGNLSANLSTTAKQKGVANTVSLIYGKLAPMVEQYNKSMNTNYPTSHFLSAKAVSTIKKMGFDPDTGEKVEKPGGDGWSIKLKDNH